MPASSRANRVRSRPDDDHDDDDDCKGQARDQQPTAKKMKLSSSEAVDAQTQTFELSETTGDLFDAPAQSLLIHACNCQGIWGAGIAKAFRQHYPQAYVNYKARCRRDGFDLIGHALLIPPAKDEDGKCKGHFIGCLFTSRAKGKAKDSAKSILDMTSAAMQDLWRQVEAWNEDHGEEERIDEWRMCKINSGLFAVPWERTKSAIEAIKTRSKTVINLQVVTRRE